MQDNSANLNLARKLAAKAGANGLVITSISRSASLGPLDGVMLQADAFITH